MRKPKEADKLKEATDLELQKKLKEEGKFKELLEEREKEVETLKVFPIGEQVE